MGLAGTNVHSRGKLDTRKSGKRKKGKAGGVWGGGDDEEDEDEEDEDYEEYDFPSNSGDQYESVKYNKKKIGSFGGNIKKRSKASNGQYEKKWVDDIVKSGGVGCKIVNLPKYVQQFENLSKNHVLEYLDETLEAATWQKQGKALTLIEALIKGKSSEDVIDYFSQSPDNVQSLQNAKKSILRRKANAVIEYFEVEEEEEDEEEDEVSPAQQTQQKTVKQPAVQQQQKVDLLNMGGNDEEEDDEMDMFKDMDTKQQQQELDMFANMTQSPATQKVSSQSQADDIMNIMGDVTATEQQFQKQKENKRKKEKY